MRTRIPTALLCAVALFVAACSAVESPTDYHDPATGLGFELPGDWAYLDGAELRAMSERGAEAIDLPTFHREPRPAGPWLFGAFDASAASVDSTLVMLSAQTRDAGGHSASQFLRRVVDAMEQHGDPVTVLSGPERVWMAGEEAWVARSSIRIAGEDMEQAYHVVRRQDKLAILLLTYPEGNEAKAHRGLAGIRFD